MFNPRPLPGVAAAALGLLALVGCSDDSTAPPPPLQEVVSYPDFQSTAGLTLVGTTSQVGSVLRMTPPALAKGGSVWLVQRQNLSAGFETTFKFRVSDPVNDGADGIAFVIHNDTANALGQIEGGIGYLGLKDALAVELDFWHNQNLGDPNGNHLGVYVSGGGLNRTVATFSPRTNMSDGAVHTVRVAYLPGRLRVDFDGQMAMQVRVDLAHVLNAAGGAWVGFTAATGDAGQVHDLTSWTLSKR